MNRFHKEGEEAGMNTNKQEDIQLVIITGMSGAGKLLPFKALKT